MSITLRPVEYLVKEHIYDIKPGLILEDAGAHPKHETLFQT